MGVEAAGEGDGALRADPGLWALGLGAGVGVCVCCFVLDGGGRGGGVRVGRVVGHGRVVKDG